MLVVGAGPAGSATAALLAEAGWSVTLLERQRLPRPKPCGECLNPGALAALRRLGMLEVVLALGPARLGGWEIGSGPAVAAGGFAGASGLGVSRDRLDAALVREAERRGATLEEGVRVTSVGGEPGGPRRVLTREADGSSGERRARMVVGADGLRSVVARALGAHTRPPRLRKLSLTLRLAGRRTLRERGVLRLSDGCTVGLAPVDAAETLWNLTVVVPAPLRRPVPPRGLAALALEHGERAGLRWTEGPEVVGGPWASGPFDWPAGRVHAEGVVLVGDAAGYYDPLTGQGIFRALRSAELAARAIDSALREGRVSGPALGRYAVAHRAAFLPGEAVQRIVELVVSRRALRDAFVTRLAARPAALAALLEVTGDQRSPLSLLRPRTLLPLLTPAPGARRAHR